MNEIDKPVQILRGHVSPETAYVVNDYPYGFRLRCKIRYWLEFKKGHGTRLVSQTTNPKVAGEVWNKPKGSTYSSGLALMYLDGQSHVCWQSIGGWSSSPQAFCRFDWAFGQMLDEDEQNSVKVLEGISRKLNPNCWADWDAKQKQGPNANATAA